MDDDSYYSSDNKISKLQAGLTAAALIIVLVVIVLPKFFKERATDRELKRTQIPAVWSGGPVTNWPRLILLQHATFRNHSPMSTGCSSLVQLPGGEVVALTAGHFLGKAGGVEPGFLSEQGRLDGLKLRTLDQEIVNWELFYNSRDGDKLQIIGLFGRPISYEPDGDQLLLRLAPRINDWPAVPMTLRVTPVEPDEPLRVIGYTYDGTSLKQLIYHARRIADTAGFVCRLEDPAEFTSVSGAPIVDDHGLLVGVVSGLVLFDKPDVQGRVHKFTGHSAAMLEAVIASAVDARHK